MTTTTRNDLDAIAKDTLYGAGVSASMVRYTFRVFSRFLREGATLELGPAEGLMTELLNGAGLPLTLVEGAETFCEDLRERFPAADVHHALFEEFETERRFDNIVLGHVLEHVDDPVAILRRVSPLLADGGRILCAVPNARSLHRQAGVLMGHLSFEEDMSPLDVHHGHRRVYTPETLRRDFLAAGLSIEHFGGYWLKPLSNGQIEEQWTQEMIEAYLRLGERYPDIAADIYVVAERG
ncbi:MAG: class I SAM-dependent methyltransferase [Planctomycetota bacterium]